MAHKSNPYKKAGAWRHVETASVHWLHAWATPASRPAPSFAGSGRRSAPAACKRSAERCASARSESIDTKRLGLQRGCNHAFLWLRSEQPKQACLAAPLIAFRNLCHLNSQSPATLLASGLKGRSHCNQELKPAAWTVFELFFLPVCP